MEKLVELLGAGGTPNLLDPESLKILWENAGFVNNVYNFSVLIWGFVVLSLVDVALKAWAMWRAGKMDMKIWFVILLLTNSLGVVPLFFINMTRKRYKALQKSENPELTEESAPARMQQ